MTNSNDLNWPRVARLHGSVSGLRRPSLAAQAPIIVATALATTACREFSQERADVPSLELQEISSYRVPDSFPVTRVVAGTNGLVVMVSGQRSHLLVGRDGSFKELGSSWLTRPVGVALGEDHVIDVVDGAARSLLRIQDRTVVQRRPIRVSHTITGAIRTRDGKWVLTSADSVGHVHITILGTNDRLVTKQLGFESRPAAVRMTESSAGDVIIALSAVPHRWIRLTASNAVVSQQLLDNVAFARDPGADQLLNAYWVTSGVVAVDDYLLASIADLRSDDRRLVLVNQVGNVVRETKINAALGFAANVPNQPDLLAMRDANGQELVRYRWRWKAQR